MKSQKFIAILSLALVLTPFVIFPVCENLKPDGSHMGCWYSGIFITSMGILIFIFAFLALMKKFPVIFSILSGAAAVICWLVPNRIFEIPPCSLCGDFSHACRASTMPAVGAICILILALDFVFVIMSFIKGGN